MIFLVLRILRIIVRITITIIDNIAFKFLAMHCGIVAWGKTKVIPTRKTAVQLFGQRIRLSWEPTRTKLHCVSLIIPLHFRLQDITKADYPEILYYCNEISDQPSILTHPKNSFGVPIII